MEAHRSVRGLGPLRTKPAFSSRNGSMMIAGISAALAGVLIYLFVSHYGGKTTTVQLPPAQVTVFRSRGYIPAGTPESLVAEKDMLKPVQVPVSQAVVGAISDPSVAVGEVTAAPIAAGQQLTVADFTHTNVTLSSYLHGDERAIGFSFDAQHGLTGYVVQGDDVDVVGQNGGNTEMIAQDVAVLANSGGIVVLRLTDKQSLAIAAASGTSTLWLEMRPVNGSTDSVTVGSLEKL